MDNECFQWINLLNHSLTNRDDTRMGIWFSNLKWHVKIEQLKLRILNFWRWYFIKVFFRKIKSQDTYKIKFSTLITIFYSWFPSCCHQWIIIWIFCGNRSPTVWFCLGTFYIHFSSINILIFFELCLQIFHFF